jgi:hypothetical protein
MSQPTKDDVTRALRVLKYLKGTINYKITYTSDKSRTLFGYSDSDWAGDFGNRRSTSGYVFMLAGAAISWSSKRQNVVALSSAEAEYIALTHAAQEAIYLRGLLEDLRSQPDRSTLIYSDNQSCIRIATNQVTSNRTKHIATKFHFIRDKIEAQEINLEYLPSEEMTADALTKAVGANIVTRTNLVMFGVEKKTSRD